MPHGPRTCRGEALDVDPLLSDSDSGSGVMADGVPRILGWVVRQHEMEDWSRTKAEQVEEGAIFLADLISVDGIKD